MANERSFLVMVKVHQWLDELLLEHQTALLSLDLSQAEKRLKRYETNLLMHMKDEEDALIPVYGDRISDVPGGAVAMFLGEHKKIRRFLAEFHDMLKQMPDKKGLALKHKTIELMDREAMYKGLLAHHHAREQNALFPWLDLVTTNEERAGLFDQCTSLAAYKASLKAKRTA
jgi:hemerythrin-like domain-containing protein